MLWLRCGWTHVVGGTVAGLVYIWGRGDYGQLGPTPTDDDDCSSTPIITSHEDTAPQDIKNIIHTPKYRYVILPTRGNSLIFIRLSSCII